MPNPVLNPATGKNDQARLKERARQFIVDYPDIHDMAYLAAQKILKQHTGKWLAPDKVYWHRFSNAASSPKTFTGWWHVGPPLESMTLIELLMRRFDIREQQDVEMLTYGGFYTDDQHHDVFDERNEVRVLPEKIMDDFWALNFSAVVTKKMQRFWGTYGKTFSTLAKTQFLAAATNELHSESLLRSDYQTLTQAVTGSLQTPMTLASLESSINPPAGTTFRTFDVGGLESREIIRLVDAQGRQILYIPSEKPAFKVFATEQALYVWVQQRVSNKESSGAFEGLFLRSAVARQQDGPALLASLKQILAQPWRSGQSLINRQDRIIVGDVFNHLRDIARQEMETDAQLLLTSNSSLRKQLWIGHLNAFIQVFGTFSLVSWPVALTLIGAGVANVGLNIDQAVNGNTAQLRRAGVLGAIFNSIYVLFTVPMLAGGASTGSVESSGVVSFDTSLEGLEGNVVFTDTPLASGPMRGIHLLANGETWISMSGLPYRVLHSDALRSWAIVDPENPFAFYGAKPVRLNAEGDWELDTAPTLSGGAPMNEAAGSSLRQAPAGKPYKTVQSGFWDTYTQFYLRDERRLSAIALARQKAVINLPKAKLASAIDQDEHLYLDPQGNVHRVYESPEGEYIGMSITRYMMEDEMFNQFLRTGKYRVSNQVGLIYELVDDLKKVGYNNEVSLYRGGSGTRGTSGLAFRGDRIKVGDFLVNTDITSFSENPYMVRVFASSQGGQASADFTGIATFNDTSVVFELAAGDYVHATPIAPFSGDTEEAESVFLPGHYFQIENIEEVVGFRYKLIKVRLKEVNKTQPGHGLYDFLTGEPFSREQYATLLGAEAESLVDLFFPLSDQGLEPAVLH
ncbi:MAG: dermonecrotic toxin domain-containing protein [Pseudomonas sp.]